MILQNKSCDKSQTTVIACKHVKPRPAQGLAETCAKVVNVPLLSRIEHKYCLISTNIISGRVTENSCYFIFDRIVYVLVTFYQTMRTLCDAYHKECESH